MARAFLTSVDLGQNELQNARVQNLASAPSSPVKGQMYFNSADNTLYWWDGTGWASARGGGSGFPGYGSVTAQTTFGQASSNGVGTTVSRTDHVHGTPTHDAAAHSAIPLSALAVPTVDVGWNAKKITGLADGTSATDAVTKQQLDAMTAGLSWKQTVRFASTGNMTLSAAGTTFDGVTTVVGDRVLAKDQSTPALNGIYVVQSGAWTRATDADAPAELVNAAVWVSEGTVNADTAWVCTTNAPITLGTTALTWVQHSGLGQVTAGAGLTKTGNTLDVGAGTGVTVAADAVSFDQSYGDGRYALAAAGVKRFTATNIGGSTNVVVNHNLGTRHVIVEVFRTASPYDTVECDVERTDTANVTLRFATAPAANQYSVTVMA